MKYKNICKIITTSAIMIMLSSTVAFANHKNYFIKSTIDYAGFGILSEVLTDDAQGKNTGTGQVASTTSPYAEERGGYSYAKVMHYGNIVTGGDVDSLQINFMNNRGSVEERVSIYEPLKETSDKGLVFSFPGLKGAMNGGYKATSNDFTQASIVSETLTNGLNQALLFIKSNANQDITSAHSLHLLLAKLSITGDINNLGSYSFNVGESGTMTTFKVEKVNPTKEVKEELIPVNGLHYSDYVKISTTNGINGKAYSYFPYKMPKGYHPGQKLHEYVNKTYKENVVENENSHLSWGQLILQAMLNNDVFGKTEQDFSSDVQTVIGQGLGSDMSRTISSIRSGLGLESMSELILNMGARPANYYMGIMDGNVRNMSMAVYTLCLIISLTFLGFMVVKLIHQHLLGTTNVIAKTSLMEGVKDIIFVAVMLGFFPALFEVLVELNYLIVRTFSFTNEYMTSFSILGGKALAMQSLAGFIMSSLFLSIDLYINFTYTVRGLVIAFLYAIAPIIIVSYLWSPNQKSLVFTFLRELVGNIFMQSFHAITMTFFAGYNTGNMTTLKALASAFCFVPMTQMFRQLVLGNNGGFSEKIGGKIAGQVANTAVGMKKAGMTYRHSKQLQESQTKANLTKQGISAVGQTVGTIATVAGTAVGFPILGTAVSAVANGIGNMVGEAQAGKEIGKTMNEQGKEQLGMGLAELGVGMGVSTFNENGDRMVGSALQTIQRGAELKGRGDAYYDPNGFMGLGQASMNMAGVGGIKAYQDSLSDFEKDMKKKQTEQEPPIKNKVSSTFLHGMEELKTNHIHKIENFDRVTGEMTIKTKLTETDLGDGNFRKINDAYNAYRDRNLDDNKMAKWNQISDEMGIKGFAKDFDDKLKILYDSNRSGFTGKFETQIIDNKPQLFYVTDRDRVTKHVTNYKQN